MDLNCSGSLKWIFLKIKSQKGTSSTEKTSLNKCYLFNRWSFCSIFWWLICPAEAWRLHSNLVEDLGIQWKSFCWCLFSTCLFFEVYLFFKKMRIMDYIHFLVCLVGYSYNPIFVICLNIPISKISDHRICGWRPRVSTTGFLLVRVIRLFFQPCLENCFAIENQHTTLKPSNCSCFFKEMLLHLAAM